MPPQIVAREKRHDDEPLHGHRQILADHLGELVGLPLELEGFALDLLVMLELYAQYPSHFDGGARGPRDGHERMVVSRVHLLDVAGRDAVAFGREPISRHHHAVGELEGEHGRTVRNRESLQIAFGESGDIWAQVVVIDFQELRKARPVVPTAEAQRTPSRSSRP